MKKLLFFLYSTFCIAWATPSHSTFAQVDSIRITHTQETNTLKNQRYVASYDYALLMKDPTKWMIKAYSLQWLDYRFGVERKLTPSFSIAIDAVHNENEVYDPYSKRWVSATEVRWYYNMASRIKKGQSANNFSGNYFSLRYETAWKNNHSQEAWRKSINDRELSHNYNGPWKTDYYSNYYDSQVSLNYGMQRRFFHFGLLDFIVSLNSTNGKQIHRNVIFLNGNNSLGIPIKPNNLLQTVKISSINYWSLTSTFKFGVAFADLKKVRPSRKGELFILGENEQQLWKINWPVLEVTSSTQSLNSSVGYEYKIGQSAFSINSYLDLSIFNFIGKNLEQYDPTNKSYFISNGHLSIIGGHLSIQPRWYFLMNNPIHPRKGVNNLSGIYAGINTIFDSFHSVYKNDRYSIRNEIKPQFINTGLLLGYQRKLFKNGFIDFNLSKVLFNNYLYYRFLLPYMQLNTFDRNNFIFDLKLGFTI